MLKEPRTLPDLRHEISHAAIPLQTIQEICHSVHAVDKNALLLVVDIQNI
jgi:hypothetical protein